MTRLALIEQLALKHEKARNLWLTLARRFNKAKTLKERRITHNMMQQVSAKLGKRGVIV